MVFFFLPPTHPCESNGDFKQSPLLLTFDYVIFEEDTCTSDAFYLDPSSNTSMRNFILVGDTTTAVGMLRVGKT